MFTKTALLGVTQELFNFLRKQFQSTKNGNSQRQCCESNQLRKIKINKSKSKISSRVTIYHNHLVGKKSYKIPFCKKCYTIEKRLRTRGRIEPWATLLSIIQIQYCCSKPHPLTQNHCIQSVFNM